MDIRCIFFMRSEVNTILHTPVPPLGACVITHPARLHLSEPVTTANSVMATSWTCAPSRSAGVKPVSTRVTAARWGAGWACRLRALSGPGNRGRGGHSVLTARV